MDGLFTKAVDVLGPLQSKAFSAIDSTLNEYPTPADETPAGSLGTARANSFGERGEDFRVAPSIINTAKRTLAFWEELDLESKKSGFDEQGVTVSQNQETSAKNRKALADQTRAFKSGGGQKDVAPLLKAYQGEIDSLTKRAKYAESAYLTMYQLFYDAPDVVPVLRSHVEVLDKVVAAEQEARRCRQELEVTKKEAATAKSLQANVRRLEERNAVLEKEMEAKVAQALEERKKKIAVELDEALEREAALHTTLEEIRETLASVQRQNDDAQSELFDLRTRTEEERASKQHELEQSAEEIERAQEQVRALERIRLELIAELERARQSPAGVQQEGLTSEEQSLNDLENSLNSKEKLIATLHEQIQQLEAAAASEREANEEFEESLEEALEEERVAKDALRAELGMRPTVEQLEELQRQNRVLQELIGTDVDEEWNKPGKDNELDEDSDVARMHRVLKETNRKVKAELTSSKIALAEKQTQVEEAQFMAHELEERNEELQALVARLEEDIAKGSGMAGRRDGWVDPSSGINGLLMANSDKEEQAGPGGSTRDPEEGGTMLEIVVGQRERFRKRVKELEEENGRLQNSLGKSQAQAKHLQNDNVNLYEKIRYLEQYNRKSSSVKRVGGGPVSGNEVAVFGAGPTGARNARYACFGVSDPGAFQAPVTVHDSQVSTTGGTEMRYRKLYEERMNPFQEFHEKEQETSYRNLRLHDKITLTGSRFLLSTKYGRTFVFFYTLLLHLLVFFVLYRSSHPRMVVLDHPTTQLTMNSTLTAEQYIGNTTHTFADTLAEQVGTLMQTTRDWTNQGSSIKSLEDMDKSLSESSAGTGSEDKLQDGGRSGQVSGGANGGSSGSGNVKETSSGSQPGSVLANGKSSERPMGTLEPQIATTGQTGSSNGAGKSAMAANQVGDQRGQAAGFRTGQLSQSQSPKISVDGKSQEAAGGAVEGRLEKAGVQAGDGSGSPLTRRKGRRVGKKSLKSKAGASDI